MATPQQTELMENTRRILLENDFPEFKRMPQGRRGFQVIDPDDEKNRCFLLFLAKKFQVKALVEGIVVAAIGFGNLDHEFRKAKEAIRGYATALQEKDLATKELLTNSDSITNRGIYLFVSCR